MEEPKNIQDPQNDGNHHNAIQDRFDGPLHWDETIYQPQEDTYYDQNFQELN
jgi:hypothetical protein